MAASSFARACSSAADAARGHSAPAASGCGRPTRLCVAAARACSDRRPRPAAVRTRSGASPGHRARRHPGRMVVGGFQLCSALVRTRSPRPAGADRASRSSSSPKPRRDGRFLGLAGRDLPRQVRRASHSLASTTACASVTAVAAAAICSPSAAVAAAQLVMLGAQARIRSPAHPRSARPRAAISISALRQPPLGLGLRRGDARFLLIEVGAGDG